MQQAPQGDTNQRAGRRENAQIAAHENDPSLQFGLSRGATATTPAMVMRAGKSDAAPTCHVTIAVYHGPTAGENCSLIRVAAGTGPGAVGNTGATDAADILFQDSLVVRTGSQFSLFPRYTPIA
jgi:hypothetical protein